jgi:uncharacterized iron-regulated membrane protein
MAPSPKPVRVRWLTLHRWMGLAIAAFLVLSGLTGAIIAFKEPLDRLLNPDLLLVESTGAALSALQIREIALRHAPEATVDFIKLHRQPGHSALVYVDGMPYDELYIDPYSGTVLGERWQQAYEWDRRHLLPTLFWLHRILLIRGSLGQWLLGTVAIIWLVSTVIGLYLTLPARRKQFFSSWKRSWLVRPAYLSFDLHRAAGSWTFIVLLVIAVSALRVTLYDAVFHPMASAVLPFHAAPTLAEPPAEPVAEPRLGWEAALMRGREAMAARAAQGQFVVDHETSIYLNREGGLYEYAVKSSLDVRDQGGETVVYFSATDGRDVGFFHPHAASGNAVEIWLEALHRSHVWGMPFRVFVSLMGVVVMVMSITGIITWLKRRA